MIEALSKCKTMQDQAMSASQTAYVDLGATVHMVMRDTIMSMNKKLSNGSIGTASGVVSMKKNEGTSKI